MSKKNTAPRTDVPKVETLQEETERLLRENQESLFQAWKQENSAAAAAPDNANDPAALAAQAAEQAVRTFGPAALAGLRSGGAFIAALKGADAKGQAKAAARLNLNREKTVAKRGAVLRADVPESQLAAAKAAEAFLYDLGVEIAKRSDL